MFSDTEKWKVSKAHVQVAKKLEIYTSKESKLQVTFIACKGKKKK